MGKHAQRIFYRFSRHFVLAAALGLGIAAGAFQPASAAAALQVHVDQGVTEPIPLAIPDFLGQARRPGYRRRGARRSRALRPVPLARSRNRSSRRSADINAPPQFRQLARDQRAGAGDRAGDGAARRPPARRFPPLGHLRRKPDAGLAILHHAGELAAHRPSWSPTRSMSASPARKAISTPASCSSRNPARAAIARQAAGGHGRGRRQSHVPHPRRLSGADAALQSDRADDRLYVLYRQASRAFICSIWKPAGRRCWAISPT